MRKKIQKHTTVSVTNGVGVHPRGELAPFDNDGMELVKLRDAAGRRAAMEERGRRRPSRDTERAGFMLYIEAELIIEGKT